MNRIRRLPPAPGPLRAPRRYRFGLRRRSPPSMPTSHVHAALRRLG
jgi:hypothetical protein